MNSHNPFDACQPWGGSYPGCNQSNDPLVDKLIGNAYHVVRTVYCNLGNLKPIYDFLQQYGMVLGVQSEAELKALTTEAKYARIYSKTPAGDRQVTDYLYVEGDMSGIVTDDATATGSWIKVATSGNGGNTGSDNDGASRIGTSTGETVEERFTDVDASIDALYDASRTVLNVAELRTVVPTHAGQRIRTLSAASASVAEIPFGGGEFYARFISGAVDDGGYIIVPTSGTLSWVRLQTGKVMLDDFGAKADWSTDNADAIRRALTFGKNYKVVVHCNSGTYLTSETVEIRKGTGLIGVSRNSTTIAKTTNNQLTITGSGTTPDAHIDAFVAIVGDIYDVNDLTGASDMSFLQLRGITFRREGLTGAGNAVQYGIWAPRVNTSQFEDLRVECGYFGFWGQDIWSNTFTSCQFLGLAVGQYGGVYIDRTVGSVHALSGTSNVFTCVGVANYQLGFHINSNQYTVLNSCTADGIRPMSGTSETFACPYFFINPHGITMNSCGSEGVAGERLRIVMYANAVYDCTVVVNAYQGQIVPENPAISSSPVFRIQNDGSKQLKVTMNACNFKVDPTKTNQVFGFITGANTFVGINQCVYDTPLIVSGGATVTAVV